MDLVKLGYMIKYFVSLFVCIFFVSCLYSQRKTSFTLNGTINADTGTLILLPVDDESFYEKIDFVTSRRVLNGKFTLTGDIDYPIALRVGLKMDGKWKYISNVFFLIPGSQSMICDVNKAREIPNIENRATGEWRSLYDNFPDNNKEGYLFKYIKSNPQSFVAMWKLITLTNGTYSSLLDSSYISLSTTLKNTYAGKMLATKLRIAANTSVGGTFPLITVMRQDGARSKISIRSNKRRLTFIDFWFSYCIPCISQFPELKKIYAKYHSEQFEMIGVSVDKKDQKGQWHKAIDRYGLPWLHYWDMDGKKAAELNINSYPTNFLLDANGVIIARHIDPDTLEKFLEKKFRKHPYTR